MPVKYDGNMDVFPAPWHLSPQDVANVDFRLERLNDTGLVAGVTAKLFGLLKWPLFRTCQWLAIQPRLLGFLLVTRDADARAVLSDPVRFPVHYNPEMRELANGGKFMLALNGPPHAATRACVAGAHTAAHDAVALARTEAAAADLLAVCGGRINVMKDYLSRASAEAAITYLGLDTDDADSFAECTLAMSGMIFGDPAGKPVYRELASHAAWRLRSIADRSIALAHLGKASGMVQALTASGTISDVDIRANLLGLATALVPTNTLAAGKMLAYLRRDQDAWRQAVAAAVAGDDARLRAVLLEAGRLSPALDPGQFRYMPQPTVVPGGSQLRQPGAVFVIVAAALRDPRRFDHPDRFDPDRIDKLTGRPFDGGMIFGHGEHECMGKSLSIDQIVVMFRLLLRQPGLQPAPGAKLVSAGPFPRQFDMVFDAAPLPDRQAMLKFAVPCPALGQDGSSAALVRTAIEALGNPVAVPAVRAALDATGVIHFASLNLIDAGAEQPVRHILLVEVNADGSDSAALAATCTALGPTLLDVLQRCGHRSYWGQPLNREMLPHFLTDRRVRVQLLPWGATGLDFHGAGELPLAAQARDAALAGFSERAVDVYEQLADKGGKRAMAALQFVRAAIRQDPAKWPAVRGEALAAQPELERDFNDLEVAAQAGNFARALIMPSAQRLKFADWQTKTMFRKLWDTFLSPGILRMVGSAGLVSLLVVALLLGWAGVPLPGGWGVVAWAALVLLLGIVLFVLLALVVVGLLYWRLFRHEGNDRPDDRDPNYDDMKVIAARENPSGFAQNHFLSVSRLKPGLFRRLSFAFALWGVAIYVRFWGRPGFIEDMGTIHFAGWFRLPGTDRMVFHANFDGSWESYLEDFVTKAHIGQTAVWSNAEGFPKTSNLVQQGASDGDRFKRWVRGQQRATQFWYSRLPGLSLDRARTNALIHAGLARAGSDTEARAWLNCFGSQQPLRDTVETSEVQSIVFTSLHDHGFGACLLLVLPKDKAGCGALFAELLNGDGLPRLHFGEVTPVSVVPAVVAYVGFSAAGLKAFGLPDERDADGLASFPYPFVAGMRSRARVLGDHGEAAPERWQWDDKVHAALWLLATTAAERDAAITAVTARLKALDGAVQKTVRTQPVDGDIKSGHFKLADGFSQPVLRGCNGSATALARDVVAPGEFLFGYHNNQDRFPPSPRLRTELDPGNLLPDTSVDGSQRFPAFQPNGQPPAFRDFGRNGSYMVIRQLEQDGPGFHAANEMHASDLRRRYPALQSTLGMPVTADWVAAKQVGRWPDGRPLIERVVPVPGQNPKSGDPAIEDFSYAREDPQGLHCPLGAHIRRANPRDSLQPDDPEGLAIANRHRILRRGRSYDRNGADEPETGLLFTAICADLERQFEFIQQRWIVSTEFHGLGEADPLVSGTSGRFTIPTPTGPIRLEGLQSYVTVRGGGDFFLPSRAAICFLRKGLSGSGFEPVTADQAPNGGEAC